MSNEKRHKPGPVPKLNDPKTVTRKIDAYFRTVYDDNSNQWISAPTFTELALALDLSETRALWRYAAGEIETCKPVIVETVKKACLRIESYHERRLATAKNASINSIFILKNRHWRDQQDVRHEGEVSTVTRIELPTKARIGTKVGEKVSRISGDETKRIKQST